MVDDITVMNKTIPQVVKLLQLTGATELIVAHKDVDEFVKHDSNVIVLIRALRDADTDHQYDGILLVDEKTVTFQMVTPTRYVVVFDRIHYSGTHYNHDEMAEARFLDVLKDIVHNGVLAEVFKICDVKPKLSPQLGRSIFFVATDFKTAVRKNKTRLTDRIFELTSKHNPMMLVGEDVSEAKKAIIKTMTGATNAWLSSIAPVMKKIQWYEKCLKMLRDQVAGMEKTLARYVQDSTRELFSGNLFVENILKTPDSLFDDSGDYMISLVGEDKNSIRITVKEVILSASVDDIREADHESNDGDSEVDIYSCRDELEVFWPLGDAEVIITSLNKTTDLTLVFAGGNACEHHPHISGTRLCEDPMIKGIVKNCIDTGDLHQLCKYLRKFLSVYNPGGPHGEQRPYMFDLPVYFSYKEAKVFYDKER